MIYSRTGSVRKVSSKNKTPQTLHTAHFAHANLIADVSSIVCMSDSEEASEKKRPTLQRERFLKLYWRSFQIIKSFMNNLFLPGQCSSACVAGWRCLPWTETTEQTEITEITEIWTHEIWTHPEGAPQAKFSKSKWKQSWKPF